MPTGASASQALRMSAAGMFPSGETVQVVAADRLARALVSGFALCEEAGVPLVDRQKVALFMGALLEFDGVEAEAEGLQQIERVLSEFRGSDGPYALRDDDWNVAPARATSSREETGSRTNGGRRRPPDRPAAG
jgi:hypothetical protein